MRGLFYFRRRYSMSYLRAQFANINFINPKLWEGGQKLPGEGGYKAMVHVCQRKGPSFDTTEEVDEVV